MANPSWRKGMPSSNPSGLSKPDAIAARKVCETFRGLHDPKEIAEAMWSIFAGIDPFAEQRKNSPNPDALPELGAQPIDWAHRMAAGKLYAEYALGKPLQGVIVDAQIQQTITATSTTTHAIDFSNMPPSVREALRAAALVTLGRAAETAQLSAPGARALDAVSTEVPAAIVTEPVHVPAHAAASAGPVRLEFPTSSNVVRATLGEDDVLEVVFRASGGDGRTYRYRNVTRAMMDAWRDAPSAGAWFAREIRAKPAAYPVVAVAARVPGVVL